MDERYIDRMGVVPAKVPVGNTQHRTVQVVALSQYSADRQVREEPEQKRVAYA